ncbi:hypothetical protein F443_23123, partial [Phytophthora nicotianae P1569]
IRLMVLSATSTTTASGSCADRSHLKTTMPILTTVMLTKRELTLPNYVIWSVAKQANSLIIGESKNSRLQEFGTSWKVSARRIAKRFTIGTSKTSTATAIGVV